MGKPKPPKIKPIPKAAPQVKAEDEDIKAAGDEERRRIAAMAGRQNTVTSSYGQRGKNILG